jgi:L-asparaginase
VYVVLNETVHAARDVTKSDTWAPETFDSGTAGPVARFTDEEMQLYREPGSYSADLSDCDLDAAPEMTVPIVATGAGAEAPLIERAVDGTYDADGFALETTGRGGTSPGISDASEAAIEAGIPVVSGSRCYLGPLGTSDEAESVIPMEDLPAWKARLHLIVALTMTQDVEGIRETVEGSKYGVEAVAPSAL